jgi:hypothetical protein
MAHTRCTTQTAPVQRCRSSQIVRKREGRSCLATAVAPCPDRGPSGQGPSHRPLGRHRGRHKTPCGYRTTCTRWPYNRSELSCQRVLYIRHHARPHTGPAGKLPTRNHCSVPVASGHPKTQPWPPLHRPLLQRAHASLDPVSGVDVCLVTLRFVEAVLLLPLANGWVLRCRPAADVNLQQWRGISGRVLMYRIQPNPPVLRKPPSHLRKHAPNHRHTRWHTH